MEGNYYRTHKSMLIVPIGDIQWAGHSDEVAIEHLQRFVAKALARETPDMEVKFLGYGDYIDYESPSNRMKGRDKYDTAKRVEEDKAVELCQQLIHLALRPTVGKWLGLVSGHHFKELSDGSTSDTWLCNHLDAPHLGDEGHITISFTPREEKRLRGPRGTSGVVEIYVHHGAGAGRTDWAGLIRLAKMAAKHRADLYVAGHLHKEATAKLDHTRATWHFQGGHPHFTLKDRTIRLVSCGGWLKGRVEGRKVGKVAKGTYVEKAMLDPVALGAPLIRIDPVWVNRSDPELGKRPSKGNRQHRTFEPEIWLET